MHVAIVYDSETGTTEKAAEAMGGLVQAAKDIDLGPG